MSSNPNEVASVVDFEALRFWLEVVGGAIVSAVVFLGGIVIRTNTRLVKLEMMMQFICANFSSKDVHLPQQGEPK